MGNNNIATIDLRLIVKRILKEKYVFLIVLSLSLIFSALYICNEPRYYTTDTKLAPEIDNSNSSGTLGTLASSLGIDMSQIKSADAITPMLYPDLMEDNHFITELFNIPITTSEGKTYKYFDYLANHQKHSWIAKKLSRKTKSISLGPLSPYHLTKEQNQIAKIGRAHV